MPQFDIATCIVQLFWSLIVFFAIYFIIQILLGKYIGEISKMRIRIENYSKLINDKIKKSDLYNQILKFVRRK